MKLRRVVTGHDDQGRSVFKSDEDLEPVTVSLVPGVEFYRPWGADTLPVVPVGATATPPATFFPPPGGFRMTLTSFPAQPTPPAADLDLTAAAAEVEQRLPGLLGHMEPDNPGMHTTDSVDLDLVVSGELVLELDDGAETLLKAGDLVVQHGTRHRWHNRGQGPAVLAAFIIGTERV